MREGLHLVNLFSIVEPKEFFVWVDPNNFMSHHNAELIGSYFSVPQDNNTDNLMFLPNPNYQGAISPFQANLLRSYMAEYNLEIARKHDGFIRYPSRLNAVYLLESEEEALLYAKTHPSHIEGRNLKRGITNGNCTYSYHDASWIDFMRLGGSMDNETIKNIAHSYWTGVTVEQCSLTHFGKPWTHTPVIEILLLGRIDFTK